MNREVIFALIDRFDASSMSALDFNDGEITLSLRKDIPAPEAAPPRHEASPVRPPAAQSDVQPERSAAAGEYITSPIVGVFYASSGLDSPAFVKAGSAVKAGEALCVIEAMKMMNKLEAEFDCEIIAVKAANGEMVEYGQALFEVKRL